MGLHLGAGVNFQRREQLFDQIIYAPVLNNDCRQVGL